MLRILKWTLGTLAVLAVAGFVAFKVSAWPGAMVIRFVFQQGGASLVAGMEPHVPPGVRASTDIVYAAGEDSVLDIYVPEGTAADARLPVIFWTHGGGFVAGDKADVAPYLKILAAKGYVAVGINYTRAPEASYPAPLRQMDLAMAWTLANIAAHGGDPANIVMAGDSAGAQLTAQYAAMTTDAAYAQAVGFAPVLPPQTLKAVLLYCGVYDAAAMATADGLVGLFVDAVLRSYFGSADPANPQLAQFSVAQHVTAAFPPAFITAGNGDALEPQSRALASRLETLGVTLDTLFYEAGHEPELPHEYQFLLDGADGRAALERTLAFLAAHAQAAR